MTTRFKRTITPQAVDRDGVAQAQQLVGAGALTLNGAFASGGVATFTTPTHVSLYSAGNLAGVTFTVVGTDRHDQPLTASLVGPNNSTVATTANFKTVTSISASAAVGSDVEAGSSGGSETPWIPLDRRELTSIGVSLSSGASLTYGLQYTFDDPFLGDQGGFAVFDDGTMTGKSAAFEVTLAKAISGIRLKVTSYVSGILTVAGGQTLD